MSSRIGIGLLWILHFLPLRVQAVVGNVLGWILYWLAVPRRRVGSINLALCFPEMSEVQRRLVLRRHFQAVTRSALEHGMLWWSSAQHINRLVRLEGVEHLHAAYGKPLILLAPHFVGLDMGGIRISTEFHPLVSMYSRLKNIAFDRLMLHARTRFGQSKLFSRHEGVRPLITEVKRGLPLYYLPDQDFGAKDAVFAPFFSISTATVNALPRLARVTGARIVPVVTRQLEGGQGYVTRFYPAWEDFPCGDVELDVTRMNAFIEARVREMPEQYFWLHKRFKTRPEGAASFYS